MKLPCNVIKDLMLLYETEKHQKKPEESWKNILDGVVSVGHCSRRMLFFLKMK